jgi:phospholipid/cholesterol/gamma-HCH transport system ATP-binding protein
VSEPVIEVRGLYKAFGRKPVLSDLTLTVMRGETLTVVGGSGSGKSVLLKTLIGLIEPDAGQVVVAGVDIAPLDDADRAPVRRRVSILFQGGALFDSMTVGENVAYPMRHQRRFAEGEIPGRVRQALATVDLRGIEDMMPVELSGGMKKRAALARAVVVDPEVLLYDEPTSGLDPINTRRIDDLILRMKTQRSVTSVVVTHDLQSAYRISDRIAMLAEGHIVAIEDPAGFRRSTHPAIRAFVAAMEDPS